MDAEATAEIVTGPLLLIGLGMGGLASQLGAVTVSAVPDSQSPEVGGLQNTATQFGASLGTALAGSILIAALTASFLTGIDQNPAVPDEVVAQANVQLSDGGEFISDAQLQTALQQAGVDEQTTQAIVDANEEARVDGLRATLALLALFAMIALFFTQARPDRAAGGAAASPAPPSSAGSLTRSAVTIRRWLEAYFGLQVVSTSVGSLVCASTLPAVSSGSTKLAVTT